MMSNGRPQIGLALSGGVARGPAHVGALAVLEEAGIPIDFVAGTSAGAIVGAGYCAGLPIAQLQELAAHSGWRTIADLVLAREGLFSFARMEEWLEDIVGIPNLALEDLAIPLAIVTTDLQTGEAVTLREGRLATAVRASCSVPGFVTPVEVNGRLLCDGGVTNNLPVDAVRALGADVVIGVDLFAPDQNQRWGPVSTLATAVETLIRQSGGGVNRADCLIVPDIADGSFLRFSLSREYMAKGAAAARVALPEIRQLLNHGDTEEI